MPKPAEEVLDGIRARAGSTAQYLRRIEAVHVSGGLTSADVEQAYRGAFLYFHSHVENTLEYLFIGLIRGRVTHRRAAVRSLVNIPSDRVATKVVFNGRRYADWLPYSRHTFERAGVYFAEGRPFSEISKSDRESLDALTIIRNALAHDSSHAIRVFRKTFTDGKALPAAQLRPAGYLRGPHAIGQTRFEFLTAQAALLLESLG
jgi:hypothetical protein